MGEHIQNLRCCRITIIIITIGQIYLFFDSTARMFAIVELEVFLNAHNHNQRWVFSRITSQQFHSYHTIPVVHTMLIHHFLPFRTLSKCKLIQPFKCIDYNFYDSNRPLYRCDREREREPKLSPQSENKTKIKTLNCHYLIQITYQDIRSI